MSASLRESLTGGAITHLNMDEVEREYARSASKSHKLTVSTEPVHSPDVVSKASISSAENAALTLERPPGINEKALLRKIDLRVVPILFLVYLAAFLDRVNIANALTLGLPKDLHLKGNESNVALTIFFVPYVLFEIPSNILLKKLKPHVWLSGCILAFGIVMLCQGFVQSYSGLLATRFFLGLAEAGVFPGSKLPYPPPPSSCRATYPKARPSIHCPYHVSSVLVLVLTSRDRFLFDQLLVQT